VWNTATRQVEAQHNDQGVLIGSLIQKIVDRQCDPQVTAVLDLGLIRADKLPLQMLNLERRQEGLYANLRLSFVDRQLLIQHTQLDFLIDTGATRSAVPQNTIPALPLALGTRVVTSAGVMPQNSTPLSIHIDDVVYPCLATISTGPSTYGLLGLDILGRFQVILDSNYGGMLIRKV